MGGKTQIPPEKLEEAKGKVARRKVYEEERREGQIKENEQSYLFKKPRGFVELLIHDAGIQKAIDKVAEMKGIESHTATITDLHEFLLHGRIQLQHIVLALDHFLMDHEHFHRMRMNHLERELLGAVITALAEEKETLKLQ